jgi:hypothetical protein
MIEIFVTSLAKASDGESEELLQSPFYPTRYWEFAYTNVSYLTDGANHSLHTRDCYLYLANDRLGGWEIGFGI